MATYRTSVTGGGTASTVDRTVTITPAVGDLLVVLCAAADNSEAAPTCTDDNGGTYDRLIATSWNSAAPIPNVLSAFARTALMPNTTATVITGVTGSNGAGQLIVLAISGMERVGSAALRQAQGEADQAASTVPSIDFAGAVLTGNLTIGAAANNSAGGTGLAAPAGWTERHDTGQSSPSLSLECITRDSGFAASTITWVNTSPTKFGALILELDTSAAAVPTPATAGATGGQGAFAPLGGW